MSSKEISLTNKVQLITYPDCFGKDLKDLKYVLDTHFEGLFGGIHILPFYPSSSDRGFSPLTYEHVDEKFGTWEDIQALSQDYEIMCDLMVNHISSKSFYFQDYLKYGNSSRYADFFITSDKFSRRWHVNPKHTFLKHIADTIHTTINFLRRIDIVFHKEGVNTFTLKKIYRPRPESPLVKFTFKNGSKKYIWCTFRTDAVDLDINNLGVQTLFSDALERFAKNGIRSVRLDAFGYADKKRGTNSFLTKRTFDFVASLAATAHETGMTTLPEVHHHYTSQVKLAKSEGVDYVYDFALPMLTLHALNFGTNKNILHWLSVRPNNAINALDNHDGLPVPDVEDLMTQEEIDATSQIIRERGGKDALRATGNNSNNIDVYQINCTYYSALGKNDDAYIASRAIQFFIPGIPQVYYVGLLAGKNDVELLNRTNIGRNILRHYYSLEEIAKDVQQEVVQRLFELIRFRNSHPAFNGNFSVQSSKENLLVLQWKKENDFCQATIDLRKHHVHMRYSHNGEIKDKKF